MHYNTKHFSQSALYALTASGVTLSLLFAAFFVAEPTIGHVQGTSTFTINQTITGETSFLVPPSNVNMTGSIAGVTGGQATGTTSFVVKSNNLAGYTVDISFFNNGTPHAMRGNVTQNESLRNYSGDVGGQPSFSFTASTAAQFAYTVTSDSSADTPASFRDNGSNACNDAGGTQNANRCWKAPATTDFRIVDRSTSAVNGATSTLTFSVVVPSNPVPGPTAETYTATATLSLLVK
jgi:hypothetical protein